MRLLRFITEEEYAKLKELSQREDLISDNKGNYYHADPQYINTPLRGDEDVKWINTLLKQAIDGFISFSNFTKSNPNAIRIQYDWCASEDNQGRLSSFTGVGWITIDELKDGFEVVGVTEPFKKD